jgi:hypothetical protein
MLVYTNLFTLVGKDPSNNKYVAMFYIWFTYLKRYGFLGNNDTVGLIVDDLTFTYINDSQFFAYISNGVEFNIEISTYNPPATLIEGVKERYNYSHFTEFTRNSLNIYLDIDCLTIRKLSSLFPDSYTNSIFIAPEGIMTEGNYGGFFVSDEPDAVRLPGFTSGWFAWTHGDSIQKFFTSVIKGMMDEADTPLYTLDQPFYNYQLYLLLTNKVSSELKIYIMDSKIISINPIFSDISLADAFFVNFCGEPGVEHCHFNKLLAFMCVDFSFMPQGQGQTQEQGQVLPQDEANASHRPAQPSVEEEHGLPQ